MPATRQQGRWFQASRYNRIQCCAGPPHPLEQFEPPCNLSQHVSNLSQHVSNLSQWGGMTGIHLWGFSEAIGQGED